MKDTEGRDRFLVDQMLNHADVAAAVARRGREEFEIDPTAHYAVEHAIELFAEAAEKLSREFKAANPRIPWDFMRELRRTVAHPYDLGATPVGVDQTWRFVKEELPKLVQRLRRARFSGAVDG